MTYFPADPLDQAPPQRSRRSMASTGFLDPVGAGMSPARK